MTDTRAAITCIGLANVDVIANVDEEFITDHNIVKTASTPLDAYTTGMILGKLKNPAFYPGGCAANTACGTARFGVPTRYIGRTGDDTYADIFRQGFRGTDVIFNTAPFGPKMTSTCLTLVTPDKDRSFAFCDDTAGWYIDPEDLPDVPHESSQYVYLESNTSLMWAGNKDNLLVAAADKYEDTGVRLVLNLNDSEIVKSSKETLRTLLERDIFFIIGNISEAGALFETQDEDEIIEKARATRRNFAITKGANGVHIIQDGRVDHVPSIPLQPSQIVNTVGAGDQFAAGLVAGLALGFDAIESCRKGIEAATGIIQDVSARPPTTRKKGAYT